MIKLVDFNPAVEVILRRIIDAKDIETGGREVEIVSAETGSNKSKEPGLDYVLTEAAANPNKAYVLCSITGPYIANEGRFQAAMGYPNVSYCDMLTLTNDVEAKVAEAIGGKRPKDELAIELANAAMEQSMLARLKHDLNNVKRPESGPEARMKWLADAMNYYGLEMANKILHAAGAPPVVNDEPVFEDLAYRVDNADKAKVESKFEDKELPGIFVDVEGTLLIKDEGGNEVVNMALVEKLQERAESSPITIWTDTNISYIKGPLRRAGILWKIVPKEHFKGCIPEEVVDDLSEAEFVAKYEISPKKFTSPADFISGEEKPLIEKDALAETPVAAEIPVVAEPLVAAELVTTEPVQDEATPAPVPSAPGTSA
jgi:hypothetical protein